MNTRCILNFEPEGSFLLRAFILLSLCALLRIGNPQLPGIIYHHLICRMIIQPIRVRAILHQRIGALFHLCKRQLTIAVRRLNLINRRSIIRRPIQAELNSADRRMVLSTQLFDVNVAADHQLSHRRAFHGHLMATARCRNTIIGGQNTVVCLRIACRTIRPRCPIGRCHGQIDRYSFALTKRINCTIRRLT